MVLYLSKFSIKDNQIFLKNDKIFFNNFISMKQAIKKGVNYFLYKLKVNFVSLFTVWFREIFV